jgi:hypothetical protein
MGSAPQLRNIDGFIDRLDAQAPGHAKANGATPPNWVRNPANVRPPAQRPPIDPETEDAMRRGYHVVTPGVYVRDDGSGEPDRSKESAAIILKYLRCGWNLDEIAPESVRSI